MLDLLEDTKNSISETISGSGGQEWPSKFLINIK